MQIDLSQFEVWFVTGSQHLYGPETLEQVARNSQKVAEALDCSSRIPCRVVFKPVVKTPDEIHRLLTEANVAPACVGLVFWMHTFSPAKMWISGLTALQKPLLHLHTQFNRDLPWDAIDMDFMNLNQSAHGDREFGFLETRLGVARKTVVGHWGDPYVADRIAAWARAACAWREAHHLRVARFGDNMREVAVTEGDKVEAQVRLGTAVNGFGVSDLVDAVRSASETDVDGTLDAYEQDYAVVPELRRGGGRHAALAEAARIEAGLRGFLVRGGFGAFTDTFEDLDGLVQLPGIAVQRLMADGYGFGAEGDWKTAIMVRLLKVMATGLPGGTSFREDYTYDLGCDAQSVLGAHMLEVCPTIAAARPSCEIHALSIGGRSDPVRLVFDAAPGPGFVASLVDLGDRFRIVANEVDVVPPDHPLPRLPVARAVWRPRPNLRTAAEAWLMAGGAHHTALSLALDTKPLTDFAEMAGIELLLIDADTRTSDFRKEVRWNQAYYHLARGLRQ